MMRYGFITIDSFVYLYPIMDNKKLGQPTKRGFMDEFLSKDTLIGTALFGVLSPGMLLTLPPESRGALFSGETSPRAVAMHCAVFAAGFALAKTMLTRPAYKTIGDQAPATLK
jgi:hypothetical protein